MIVCGADNGGLLSYNADKFIKGEAECLLFKNNKHTGAVKALDFNPFQVGIYGRHRFRQTKNFQRKIVNIFLPIILSICSGCSKEPSH